MFSIVFGVFPLLNAILLDGARDCGINVLGRDCRICALEASHRGEITITGEKNINPKRLSDRQNYSLLRDCNCEIKFPSGSRGLRNGTLTLCLGICRLQPLGVTTVTVLHSDEDGLADRSYLIPSGWLPVRLTARHCILSIS